MTLLAFIPDGYTETGILREVPGLHPRIKFRFRPLLIEQRVEYFAVAEKLQGMQLRRLVALHLSRQLVDWDLKDPQGNVIPLTPEAILRLKPRVFDRLFEIIAGEAAPDELPEQTPAEVEAVTRYLLEAAATGKSPQQVREEHERKN